MKKAILILLALSVLLMGAQIASVISRNQSNVAEGTTTYTDGGGDDGEATVFTFSPTTRVIVHTIWFDLAAMAQNGLINCYYEADGTNSTLFSATTFTNGTTPDLVPVQGPWAIDDELICKYDEQADEGANRDIDYQVIYTYHE